MSWHGRARRRRFLLESLWLIPVASMLAALLLAPVVRWIDDQTRWILLGFTPDGARAVVSALSSSLLTFLVFAFSTLLLVVQMASSQFTPRVIARVFEHPLTKWTVGALLFAWTYSLAALGRVEDRVPQLPIALATLLSLVGVGLFLYLVQRVLEGMRPVSFLTQIALDTRAVMESVYPHALSAGAQSHTDPRPDREQAGRVVRHRGSSGALLAFDVVTLMRLATQTNCTIEVVPQVGDFLAAGEDLFVLYGAGAETLGEAELNDCIALGTERTLEQDPAFGLRIIVDVANKALSPGINDPTTAVLAIDQLHYLLYFLAGRQLDTGVLRDAAGRVRLMYRTPDWEDFLTLAVFEILAYGAGSPQVTRRLQAMFEHLLQTVPHERTDALRKLISLLHRTIERTFGDPEERALALHADLQGFGGRQPRTHPS